MCIIDDFIANNFAFLSASHADAKRFLREVEVGDIIAIADGLTIKAIARVRSNPQCLTTQDVELGRFKLASAVARAHHLDAHLAGGEILGVDVSIVLLDEQDHASYRSPGVFCEVNPKQAHIRDLMTRFVPCL